MTKEQAVKMAEALVRRARINYEYQYNKANISDAERLNLENRVEFARIVLALVREHYKEAT